MILDGRIVAQKIQNETKEIVQDAVSRGFRAPCLQVIMVGDNKASEKYVAMKEKACREAGITTYTKKFSTDVYTSDIEKFILECNENDGIDGILLQLPLPGGYNERSLIEAIDPWKDVDALTYVNSGKLYADSGRRLVPCTAEGIRELIRYYCISTEGKHVVVVGRGLLVGKPIATLLASKWGNSTVTLCHSKTKNLEKITKTADILISAAGVPHLIKQVMVHKDATVIDAGTGVGPDGKIVGDVDFETMYRKVKHITPNPGGVGPMTVAMLLKNTVYAWADRREIKKNADVPLSPSASA